MDQIQIPVMIAAGTGKFDSETVSPTAKMKEEFSSLAGEKVIFRRADDLDVYAEYPVDLVLSGHAHGGQFRLPVVNAGLIAPNQGLFPKYTSGRYQSQNCRTEMIVSRGIGESIIPIRFFNMPEIVSVTIKR